MGDGGDNRYVQNFNLFIGLSTLSDILLFIYLLTFETISWIGFELWRNLGLALACVFVITFVLLADTTICLMVFTCVAFTLVDVVGALNFWETTLDPLSSVNIILAVGLCIDYPAHIAHSFLVATGNFSYIHTYLF